MTVGLDVESALSSMSSDSQPVCWAGCWPDDIWISDSLCLSVNGSSSLVWKYFQFQIFLNEDDNRQAKSSKDIFTVQTFNNM